MKEFLLKNKLKIMRKSGTYSRLRQKFNMRYRNRSQHENLSNFRPVVFAQESPEHSSFENISLDQSSFPSSFTKDSEERQDQRANLIGSIRQWATDFQISQTALQSLTQILNGTLDLNLPKDPRTIMATPRSLNLEQIDETGSYWHQGLEVCLRTTLKNIQRPSTVSLNFNIDGLPVYNSSTKSFWPILFNIQELPEVRPQIIGIFYGESKPKDASSYLNPFVEELLRLLDTGLDINSHRIVIKIRCFICDTPARAFIKGVINFNGKFGCIKCTTKGTYSQVSKTMVFPDCNALKRTDELFRAKDYTNHQRSDSPLIKLPINMIEDIIVADSLHLLELGVMKKLLKGWRTGCMSMKTKWSTSQKAEISKLLIDVRFPVEIHRRMRSLNFISLWKGLEYRNFLNYAGIVVLKDYLPEKYYTHFLVLFCAVRICSVKRYLHMLEIARSLFNDFLRDFKSLYGVEFMTSNIHNLCHVVDEVVRFGPLPTISAYPFENCLHSLKKMVKPGPNPLAQIANRITENMQTYEHDVNFQRPWPLSNTNSRQKCVDIENTNDDKIVLSQFTLSADFKDKWVLTNDQTIVAFSKAVKSDSRYFVEGQKLKTKNNYFEKPFKSSYLHVFIAEPVFSGKIVFDIDFIFCKLVAIPRKEGVVFAPLMHTII